LAAADDREGLDGAWELGGDVVPLIDLLERIDMDGPALSPSPWALALLAEDLLVGSSAAEELGVGRSDLLGLPTAPACPAARSRSSAGARTGCSSAASPRPPGRSRSR